MLSCENGKPLLSPDELKARIDPKQDPKNLHKSYFKLCITNDLITSKTKLLELYSLLAYGQENIAVIATSDQEEP